MIEQLLKEIRLASEALLTDGTLQSEYGNKAAGTRARKASLQLERLTKAFRKASLEPPEPVPARLPFNWNDSPRRSARRVSKHRKKVFIPNPDLK